MCRASEVISRGGSRAALRSDPSSASSSLFYAWHRRGRWRPRTAAPVFPVVGMPTRATGTGGGGCRCSHLAVPRGSGGRAALTQKGPGRRLLRLTAWLLRYGPGGPAIDCLNGLGKLRLWLIFTRKSLKKISHRIF